MGNLKKKTTEDVPAKGTSEKSRSERKRVIFKDVSDVERQKLRIDVYPYLM